MSCLPAAARYWREPQRAQRHVQHSTRPTGYVTFEPDPASWNNIRMAFENAAAIAYSLGRALVLPPKRHIYLLPGEWRGMEDFYSIDEIKRYGLQVLSFEEWFELEVDRADGRHREHPPPPEARQHPWERHVPDENFTVLTEYLRRVGQWPGWNLDAHCLLMGDSADGTDEADAAFCAGRMPVRNNVCVRDAWHLHFPVQWVCSQRSEHSHIKSYSTKPTAHDTAMTLLPVVR
jgi:hypothetical protein